jgi:hypothetical protein
MEIDTNHVDESGTSGPSVVEAILIGSSETVDGDLSDSDASSNYEDALDSTPSAVSPNIPTTIAVSIRAPTPDAVCPISMDTITTSEVPGFEGFVLDEEHPSFTEVVLECGHSFSSCFLIVYWLTNPMRCPLCRHGLDSLLDPNKITDTWRKSALEHVARIKQDTLVEQEERDREALLQLDTLNVSSTATLQVYMCVYFMCDDGVVENTCVSFRTDAGTVPIDVHDYMTMHVPRAHIRVMSGVIRRHRCSTINMVVFAKFDGNGVGIVELANSGMVNVPSENGTSASDLGLDQVRYRDDTPIRSNDVAVVQGASEGNAVFDTSWLQYNNTALNTLTGITFAMSYHGIASCVNHLFTEV